MWDRRVRGRSRTRTTVEAGRSAQPVDRLDQAFGLDRSDDGIPSFDFRVVAPDPGVVPSNIGFSINVEHDLAFADEAEANAADPILARIEHLLDLAGTDKSRILSVTIYLKDIDADFAGMNSVWDEWLPKGAQPARATVEAKLCEPEILVELSVVAALP